MKRRICSVLLALCMATTLLPQTALAGEETTIVIQLPGNTAPEEVEEAKQPGDVLSSDLSLTGRMMLMSTYEELQLIVSIAVLIVAILSYSHKK